jgi:F0F1-type ATP synthase assembly protein I
MEKMLRELMADLATRAEVAEAQAQTMESDYLKGLYDGYAGGYSLAADMVQDVLAELLKKEGK